MNIFNIIFVYFVDKFHIATAHKPFGFLRSIIFIVSDHLPRTGTRKIPPFQLYMIVLHDVRDIIVKTTVVLSLYTCTCMLLANCFVGNGSND